MTDAHEQQEHAAIRALQDLLAGRAPSQEDTTLLTGEIQACITSLHEALRADGVGAARKAFIALAKDRPWLNALASSQPPDVESEL